MRGIPQATARVSTDDPAGARCQAGSMSATARPCREELEALVRNYHHVESERERAHPEGSVRQHLEQRLHEQGARFEHVLAACVSDERGRRAWRAYLHHRGAEPSGPPAADPVLFRGCSEAGSVVKIRKDPSGELAVAVDGHVVERLPVERVPGCGGTRCLPTRRDRLPSVVRRTRSRCARYGSSCRPGGAHPGRTRRRF